MARVVQPTMVARVHAPQDPTRQREVEKHHTAVLAPPDPIQPKALATTHCAQLAMWGHIQQSDHLNAFLAPKAKVEPSKD